MELCKLVTRGSNWFLAQRTSLMVKRVGPPLFHLLSLRGGAPRACMLYVNELKQKTVTQK